MKSVKAQKIRSDLYLPFGDLIKVPQELKGVSANMETAERFHHVAKLEWGKTTKPNLSIYRCRPYKENPIEIGLLEKHPLSTQLFLPMRGLKRYLIVVALGGESPDLTSLQVFWVPISQGVTYRPGIWHHPMIALEQETDFASLIWEEGSPQDCLVKNLTVPYQIQI